MNGQLFCNNNQTISGAIANLAAANPSFTVSQIKAMLSMKTG